VPLSARHHKVLPPTHCTLSSLAALWLHRCTCGSNPIRAAAAIENEAVTRSYTSSSTSSERKHEHFELCPCRFDPISMDCYHSLLASAMVCRAGHLEVILKLRCIYVCTRTATGFQASGTVCMRGLQNVHLACCTLKLNRAQVFVHPFRKLLGYTGDEVDDRRQNASGHSLV